MRSALVSFAAALAAPLVQQVTAAAPGEPSGNQIMLGAWVDTSIEGGSDNPKVFNTRMGQNFSIFQLSQDFPLPAYDPVTGSGGDPPQYLIQQSQTDAAIYLTVYPTQLDFEDDDWTQLTDQLNKYLDDDRTVFLRFAPEMQGTWNPAYGYQPVAFLQLWDTMYQKVRAASPDTIIVWAPNLGQGYPYSQEAPTNQTEFDALDTNGDGQITSDDDPFGPYHPAGQYDWVGLSVYYKGPGYQDLNQPNQVGYCGLVLENIDTDTGVASQYNFYETYCANNPDIACMFAESGAAYHVDVSGGSTNLEMQQAWWEACITNDTLYDTYPRLKLNMHFEYEKTEDDDLRDYRLANETAIVDGFSSALDAFSTRVAWADYRAAPSDVPSSGEPSTAMPTETTSSCTKYCGQVAFTTDRNPSTGAPSLFGDTRSSSAARLQAFSAVGVTTLAMMSAGVWLSGRSQRNVQRSLAQ